MSSPNVSVGDIFKDMKLRILIIFIIILLFHVGEVRPAFALEHARKDGLFSMDIPAAWHWFDYQEEAVITYPDAKTVAIDIQLVPSVKLSEAEIKKELKDGNEKIKQGVEAHQGILLDEKEIMVGGVFATQVDFKTAKPNVLNVTYISFFAKGYVFTITYGSQDEGMRSMLDDAVATFKFK